MSKSGSELRAWRGLVTQVGRKCSERLGYRGRPQTIALSNRPTVWYSESKISLFYWLVHYRAELICALDQRQTEKRTVPG